MRKPVLLFVVVAAAALVACGAALAQGQPPERPGAERYIVVLNKGVSDPGQATSAMARRHGLEVGFVYSRALKGFSAVIPNEHVAAVRADERVAYIERDQTMHAEAQTLPWGIDKINADTSSTIAGNGSGAVSNVNAYIIDSGIYLHKDLNVVKRKNFTGDGKRSDCYGHGTHVAGTVAAEDNTRAVVGVAPGARLIGVKVL